MKALKATTYWRKDLYHTPTKLRRKQTSRRKHLHQWLIFTNILTDWSKDYLFFKKYIKLTLTFQFFKNSFLIYNLLLFKNTIPRDFIGYESSLMINIVGKIIKYSSKVNSNLFPFLKQFNTTHLLYITTNVNFEDIQKTSELTSVVPYLIHQSSLYVDDYNLTHIEWVGNLILLLYTLSFSKLIEVYKVIIMLTLSTIIQNH